MKLKKAMRLYPISRERTFTYTRWMLGNKYICQLQDNSFPWGGYGNGDSIKFATEREAVAWLIEGAERKPEPELVFCRCSVTCPHCGKII